MAKETFYDINEVCRLLNTTSRTLRYYEEKGIIQSTKSDFSSRRQYTSAQIDQIRHVIILRTLGLSVKTIAELQRSGKDLKTAIEARRAEIMAIIDRKYREINILNEAICLIDRGKSIFENPPSQSFNQTSAEWREIAQKCTEGIIHDDAGILYAHLSTQMKEYMPLSVYESCRRDTLAPLGAFVSFEQSEIDTKSPNIIYHYVKYENLGLKIKYIFHQHQIHGFWMGYYSLDFRNNEVFT